MRLLLVKVAAVFTFCGDGSDGICRNAPPRGDGGLRDQSQRHGNGPL